MVGKMSITVPDLGACSGALVGDQVVLVAAHCLHGIAQGCEPKVFKAHVAFAPMTGSIGSDQPTGKPGIFQFVPSADNETIEVDDVAWFPGSYDPLSGDCRLQAEQHLIPADSLGALACDDAQGNDANGQEQYGWHRGKDIALLHLAHAPVTFDAAAVKLPVITNLHENRDLGNTKHFSVDPAFFFLGFRDVVVVGFDTSYNRGAGRFGFDFVQTDTVAVDCFGNTAHLPEPRIRFSSTLQMAEHGDSGGPLIVYGSNNPLGSPALPPTTYGYVLGVFASLDQTAAPTYEAAGEWLDRMLSDWDGDSKPDAQDDCPIVYDPMQQNCNAAAERAQNVAVQGDACDVRAPCPDAKQGPGTPLQGEICSPIAGVTGAVSCESRLLNSSLTTTPLVGLSALTGAANAFEVAFNPVFRGISTSARFCQNVPDGKNPIHCLDPQGIKNDRLTAPESATDPRQPWHKVSFFDPFPKLHRAGTPPPRGQTLPMDYTSFYATSGIPGGIEAPDLVFSQGFSNTTSWFYQEDYAYWKATTPPLIQLPSDPSQCDGVLGGTCLDGVFWLNGQAPTPLITEFNTQVELLNSHTPLAPDALRFGYCKILPSVANITGAAPTMNATPGSTLPSMSAVGELLWPFTTGIDRIDRPFELNASPETQLVQPTTFGIVGALQHDATWIALAPDPSRCTGTALQADVASRIRNLRWASAVEPDISIGRLPGEIYGVSLRDDGTAVEEGIVAVGAELDLASRLHDFGGLILDRILGDPPPPRSDSSRCSLARRAAPSSSAGETGAAIRSAMYGSGERRRAGARSRSAQRHSGTSSARRIPSATAISGSSTPSPMRPRLQAVRELASSASTRRAIKAPWWSSRRPCSTPTRLRS